MEIKGKWKTVKMMSVGEDGTVWNDEAAYKASPAYDPEDPFDPFATMYYFDDDGEVKTLMPIPEGVPQSEIDDAINSGEAKLVDGMLLMRDKNPTTWKEEDGKFFIKFASDDDTDGRWQELNFVDGLMEMMFYRLEKAD